MQGERFFPSILVACAPLLLWALHLFGAYVFAAAACLTSLADMVWLGISAIRVVLLASSIAALLYALWLLLRAVQAWRATRGNLLSGVRMLCALLGLIGIAWTSLPVLMLPVCVP